MAQATTEKNTSKMDGLLRTVRAITADQNGDLPKQIMILRCGEWPDSIKGNLMIVQSDLEEFKKNFDDGVGLVSPDVGLPIDFSHNAWEQAAGWIKGLVIEGDALYADVEWSTAGADAINGGMFKCISPSFYPAARGGWEDPEDLTNIVGNVLVGAGLTNIPFFKDLTPVKASASDGGNSGDNVIFISASKKEKSMPMNLDELRVKDASAISAEEKQFLADNRDKLSGEELKKYGLEASNKPETGTVSAEDAQLLADIRSGKVKVLKEGETAVNADRLTALESRVEAGEKEKAEAIVDSHIARGAIKADSRDRWTQRLLTASGEDRTNLETDLKAMSDNELLAAGEQGGNGSEIEASEAIAELDAKVRAARAEKEENKTKPYSQLKREILASDTELAAKVKAAQAVA